MKVNHQEKKDKNNSKTLPKNVLDREFQLLKQQVKKHQDVFDRLKDK